MQLRAHTSEPQRHQQRHDRAREMSEPAQTASLALPIRRSHVCTPLAERRPGQPDTEEHQAEPEHHGDQPLVGRAAHSCEHVEHARASEDCPDSDRRDQYRERVERTEQEHDPERSAREAQRRSGPPRPGPKTRPRQIESFSRSVRVVHSCGVALDADPDRRGGWGNVLRLVGLLAGLSRAADIGFGLPQGAALRSSALAVLLGRSVGCSDDDLRAGMYGGLLMHLGCIGFSHETARLFGDELVHNAEVARTNVADPRDVLTSFLPRLVRGRPPIERVRVGVNVIARGRRFGHAYESAACEIGRDAARRLRLPSEVERAVYHSFEHWSGRGVPDGLAGDDVPMGSRLAATASVASLFHSADGVDAAVAAVRQQAGSILDPGLVDHFARRGEALLGELDAVDPLRIVLDAEPQPTMRVTDSQLVTVAAVFGDIVDVKTPTTHAHSRHVAGLARRAGERLGFASADVAHLEVAGLLHDLGRVAVPNTIWEKPGPLGSHEWEQVRLHAYHSERILAASEPLAALAPVVGAHHERLDGDGYHRGCTARELDVMSRVLAVADVFAAMGEPRAHRPALAPEHAERELLGDARRGALDADAVNAMLSVAGHEATTVAPLPAGLTEREVEVLRLLAEGCSNRRIAERLHISRRTAEHHVQHIYTKVGVSNRASVALFAIEHGLLPGG